MTDTAKAVQTIEFTLPIQAIPKARPRLGRGGHVFTPPETKRFEKTVQLLSKRYAPKDAHSGPIKLTCIFWFKLPLRGRSPESPHTVRPDGDNLLKAICDALNGIFWVDDCQVYDKRAIKMYSAIGHAPKIEIAIEYL